MDNIISQPKIARFLALLLGVCVLVIVAIMLDLWDGVHTAVKTGAHVHSHRLRETIQKICEYFRFIAVGFLVDCLGFPFSFYFLPFAAMLFGLGLIVVEIKSMFEHAARRKTSTSRLQNVLRDIVHCAHEHDAAKIVDSLRRSAENSEYSEYSEYSESSINHKP